ncbi:Actin cytoskeleton-regulatory complex protein end3, putative isoform 9 [Hibiscus syriacus]|uniref:Actin cytoskeleton-regulatory complex protein end3, putative isoform 9 n=1 Tax=Hibiscus syriacus TaxID=106335 RepID=A0A6A3AN33_HIBSY|nr:uncharacterized protein ZK546.14-like [Hibiscus syriacus]XP_039000492.1 uncharacterized protein ZK546.14-like [Hibiscus syriacus]XP_039000493.1 uncharacterized protein ZK546.14-like [Hibiscus syriacus]KAE8704349.1 Actin cytoskeleton-regulatory complex protein end3, putative isoform 9 [Hibiscus syriacus]
MEEDRYPCSRRGSGVWRSLRDGDFEEEDVWAVLKERKDSTTTTIKLGRSIEESSSAVTVRRQLPSAARVIPRTFSAIKNGSSSSHEANGVKHQQQSAPVRIPDWSKFSRNNKSKKGSSRHDDDDDEDDDDRDFDDDDEEEFDSKLPPHEFLAKRQARSQISSFSVFEGVGRKLKGRDLRKVRNAVLTKTGFLE